MGRTPDKLKYAEYIGVTASDRAASGPIDGARKAGLRPSSIGMARASYYRPAIQSFV